jgi:hypothetical protein
VSGPGTGANEVDAAFAQLPSPEALLSEAALEQLDTLDTEDLRRIRSQCEVAEEGISYARRLLQGRLDILRAALDQSDHPGADGLLAALPAIMADQGHVSDPAQARSLRVRVPADADRYAALIDAVIAEDDVPQLPDRAEDDLSGLQRVVEILTEVEHELSARRRALFSRIDGLREELLARYKDGRADVRDLLG